jgi:putative ABC transport system permease protein
MTLDGAPGYLIVGVAPAGFAFPGRADVYRSHGIASSPDAYEDRARRGRWAVARLADGMTPQGAQALTTALARRLEREFPATNTGLGLRVVPLRDQYVGQARPFLLLLLGAVALVLAIACCNVTNLLLSRGLDRERELALRTAIGASRGRIVALLVGESVALAALASVLGVALGWVGVRLIARLIRLELPVWLSIGLSWRVLLFALAVSLVAGVLAGLVPAWRLGRGDLTGSLREGGRGASAGRRHRSLRSALVVGEMAVAVVLLVGAGLLVRSFRAIERVDPGFDPESLLTFRVELGWRAYPELADTARFQRELLRRLAELPGVRTAAMVDNLPLGGRPRIDDTIALEGQSAGEARANPFVNRRTASPSLFETLHVPLLRGELFTERDRAGTPRVAVVSEALARRFWPRRDPLGARFRLGATDFRSIQTDDNPWITVVGVVGDVRHDSLTGAPALDVYLPFEQVQTGSNYFLLRVEGDPAVLSTRAPELVWTLDREQSFFDVRVMRERVADRTWVPRLSGAVFGAFGGLAALLASVGVYAVLAFGVAQRRRELGVRGALGASASSLSRLVLRDGLRLAALGIGLGLLAAFGLSVLLSRFLFQVGAGDLVSFAMASLLLLVVAAVACWVPAWRAGRIDPVESLGFDG